MTGVVSGPSFKSVSLGLTIQLIVTVQRESSAALGQGCRLGFLGTLHMSVLVQRLNDEYGADVCVTAPTVPYKSQYIRYLRQP